MIVIRCKSAELECNGIVVDEYTEYTYKFEWRSAILEHIYCSVECVQYLIMGLEEIMEKFSRLFQLGNLFIFFNHVLYLDYIFTGVLQWY